MFQRYKTAAGVAVVMLIVVIITTNNSQTSALDKDAITCTLPRLHIERAKYSTGMESPKRLIL
jgi:hypothetical protein